MTSDLEGVTSEWERDLRLGERRSEDWSWVTSLIGQRLSKDSDERYPGADCVTRPAKIVYLALQCLSGRPRRGRQERSVGLVEEPDHAFRCLRGHVA